MTLRRPALFATLATLAVIAIAHARAVFTGAVYILKDVALCHYPTKALVRSRLLAGDVPHFAPELGLGGPLLADPGVSVFYPPNVALVFPFPWCVGLFLWTHLAIGAIGTIALLRRFGVRWTAATFGGLCFALGGYATSMLWSGMLLVGMVWIPAILAAVDALAERRSFGRLSVVAMLWGSQLASGEAQSALVAGLLAGAWMLVRPAPAGGSIRSETPRRVAWLALASVASAGAAAVQLLPYATLFAHHERKGGLGLVEAQHWSLHPARLFELLLKDVYGDPNVSGSFFAYALDNEGGEIDRWPWMATPYVGAVVLVLVGAAWASARERKRLVGFLSAAAAVALLLSLGRYTPAFAAFFRFVPFANAFRYPAKYYLVVAFALPCLAALGLDRLGEGDLRARRGALAASLVAVLVAASLWIAAPRLASGALEIVPQVAPLAASGIREAALVGLLPIVLASALLLSVGRFRHAALLLGALGVLDLVLRVTWPLTLAPASVYARPDWLGPARPGREPRVYSLLGDVDLAGPSSPLTREEAVRGQVRALTPNTGLLFGLGVANLYTNAETTDDQRFWTAVDKHPRAALDVFGIELVVRPPSSEPDVGPEALTRVAALADAGVEVVRNPTALPRVYFAGQALAAADDLAAIAAIEDPRVRAGAAVILERPSAVEPRPGARAACTQAESQDGDDVRAVCDTEKGGFAVFSTALYWGWSASIDGRAASLERANGRAIAVEVPPGRHEVVISYREPTFVPGALATLATMLALGGATWVERRRASRSA